MSAETIRDVIIRVSVENGNMRLGPIDTSAAIESIRQMNSRMGQKRTSQSEPTSFAAVSNRQFSKAKQFLGRGTSKLSSGPRKSPGMLGKLSKGLGSTDGAGLAAGGSELGVSKLNIALAALQLTLDLTQKASEQATAANNLYWSQLTKDATEAESRLTSGAIRSFSQQNELTTSRHNTSEFERFLPNFEKREKQEQSIRNYEATQSSPEFKSQFRSRTLRQNQLEERQESLTTEREFKQKQLKEIRNQTEKLKQDKGNVQSKGQQIQSSIRAQKREALTESNYQYGKRQAYRAVAAIPGALGFNMGDGDSGYLHTQDDAVQRLNVDGKKAEIETALKLKQINEEISRGQETQRTLSEDIARIDQQRLTTTQEMRQNAYEAVQKEQERLQQGNIAFGSSSVADQNRILRLQQKHERIEAQKESNRREGRDEFEGVEQYSQAELRTNVMGNIAGRSMREQAERNAKATGFKQESNIDELQQDLDKANSLPLEDRKADVSKSANDAKEMATAIRQAIEAKHGGDNTIELLKQELQNMRSQYESDKFKRNAVFN